jgi:bifunctional non-homologous end joining protein LigD
MTLALRVGRHTVQLTNPDKILFPADGITKRDLAEYYKAVAPRMVPHLRDRPLNLQRFPEGIGRPGFFQQEMPDHGPDWLEGVTVAKEGGSVRHLMAQNAATLVYLANQGCITPHAWLSRAGALERPDQIIFDLDPPGEDDPRVRGATLALGALLRELGLAPFVKTTGSRGYHVMVPLDAGADFEEVRAFAESVAEALVRERPAELTTETRKAQRRGRVFVDTMRNAYAHTAVPPFAVRARPGAPVATPIAWEELEDRRMRPARFTLRTVLRRLEAGVDPWRDYRRRARGLARARQALGPARPGAGAAR